MKRTWWGLGLLAVLLPAGTFSAAQGPATDDARSGGAIEAARILVKQLEAQVESQRVALRQTEANLEQARALLNAMKGGSPSEKTAAELRAAAEGLERQLERVRRLVRDPKDPVVRHLTRKLESVRGEIKDLEAK